MGCGDTYRRYCRSCRNTTQLYYPKRTKKNLPMRAISDLGLLDVSNGSLCKVCHSLIFLFPVCKKIRSMHDLTEVLRKKIRGLQDHGRLSRCGMHVYYSLYIHPFLKVEPCLEPFTCGRSSTAFWCSRCFASKECDCNSFSVSNHYAQFLPL